MLASPPKTRPPWRGTLAPFSDREIDDDLLRYLVGTIHVARGTLVASLGMAALITAASWAMTGERIFLDYCLGHFVVGVARIHCVHAYSLRATPTDSREKTLGFDTAFVSWSTLYALLLGLTCYSLEANRLGQETLPLAVGTSAGFTIAFVTRSSGRLKLLLRQILAILVPVVYGMLALPITNGRFYAAVYVGLAIISVVLGRAANAKIVELYRVNESNRRMARLDTLTGVMNRFSFGAALDEALQRKAEPFALVMIDLDRFKEINDTLGHIVGDDVIVQTARRLREVAGPRDFVARLGGDEFAILARGDEIDVGGAGTLAIRVLAELCRSYELEALLLPASASVGVAIFPDHGTGAFDLMKHADIALYEAKRAGRGCLRVFDDSMRLKFADAHLMEIEIAKAIRADQFEAWFQPIQNIETGMITGYEALARWRHPTLGLIPPNRFIPAAEHSGAIVVIGQAILEKACATAASWDPELTIAVNLSPVQFRRPKQLVEAIKATLKSTRLAPSRLFLEITESLLMEDTPQTREAINELAEFGVRFSLDDFGAGYSSLSYIQNYPFSKIKIDKKFIDHVDSDNVSTAIIASVRVLAERIRMEIVAEGVETRVQHVALRDLGINMAQGYLYGRPSPRIIEAPTPRLAAAG